LRTHLLGVGRALDLFGNSTPNDHQQTMGSVVMRKEICRGLLSIVLLGALSGCAGNGLKRPSAQLQQPKAEANSELLRLAAGSGDCNQAPDAKQSQHVVGYGSLMQEESRKRTAPGAGPASPVVVKGYRRGWFAKGDAIGFDTTYLGAVADAKSHLNAVIYRIDPVELQATDQRESFYCRRALDRAAVTILDSEAAPVEGQIWIYVNKPEGIATPTERYPIVQSYVDIFVSGCLEQEQQHHLTGFARQCLTTTTDWSPHWVSDRIYPRRPFIYQPKARQIDKLLSDQLPDYFQRIRIEAGR
jgi:gamma-glutamylcyclotransferase (GGCT)/AIG2-like uncharacterized protein YtfP